MSGFLLLAGIDEETGALSGSVPNRWQVFGKGLATLYHQDRVTVFGPGRTFCMDA